jgi:acetyl esterase
MSDTALGLDELDARALAKLVGPDAPLPADPSVEDVRGLVERLRVLNGPGPEMAAVTEHAVPGADEHVRVRLLQPVPNPRGVLIYLPLGGWVAGSLDTGDTIGRKLADRTSCTVALIDHRRAPEHPHPAPIDDVDAALRWLWSEQEALGHAELPHMILGEGMGATLAAVAATRATREADGPRLALQFLVCPLTDARADAPDVAEVPFLGRGAFDRCWEWYVADDARRDDPDVSPLRIPDATGLPPTVLVTAELDPAGPEGMAYAELLSAAGVAVAHRHYAGQIHAFSGLLVLPLGERVIQHIVRAVHGYTGRFCAGTAAPPTDLNAWLNRIIK